MRWFVLGVVVLALAGCGHGANGISKQSLSQLVLQPSDVGQVFTRFDVGEQVRIDLPSGGRSDAKRFGRVGGWKARYRRAGSAKTSGPLVIESRADAFRAIGGAKEELDAIRSEWGTAGATVQDLGSAGPGDDALLSSARQGAGVFTTRFFQVAWRHANVVGFLTVSGFDHKVTREDALRLARKQQRRIARAG